MGLFVPYDFSESNPRPPPPYKSPLLSMLLTKSHPTAREHSIAENVAAHRYLQRATESFERAQLRSNNAHTESKNIQNRWHIRAKLVKTLQRTASSFWRKENHFKHMNWLFLWSSCVTAPPQLPGFVKLGCHKATAEIPTHFRAILVCSGGRTQVEGPVAVLVLSYWRVAEGLLWLCSLKTRHSSFPDIRSGDTQQ